MRRFLLVLTFALLLSACDLTVDPGDNGNEQGKSVDSVAVGFQAYVNRATKAGQAGALTTDILKTTGFGVLGYTSNGIPFNERSQPDFMYNQPVTCPSGTWTYEPVKYWPNEENDRVSFFAYAPFVEVTPSTGLVAAEPESGILGLSHYLAEGDPQVWYRTELTPGRDVDLCWGIPFLNQAKQKTNERLQFDFHHALSQLNVQIDADMDVASQTTTRIYVRSVTFTGFMTQGTLNLNSTGEPVWNDISGTERPRREPVTITDGRIDGEEGRQGAVDVNEKLAKLNPLIIQRKPYDASEIDGVKETPANLFDKTDETAPVLVVPLAGTPMSVTIVYDVETVDNGLGLLSDGVTHGLSIENRITRQVLLDNGNTLSLEAGKKYIVKLHLGLTSVQFDASVSDWQQGPSGQVNPPVEIIHVNGVTVDPTSLSLNVGGTAQLSATVTPSDALDKSVTWISGDESVATVSSDGLVTAVGNGNTTITVRTQDGGFEKSCAVEVLTPATGLYLPDTYSINKGTQYTFENVIIPADATTRNIAWESSDPTVATIGENGLITAIKKGTTIIKATLVEGAETFTASCSLTVKVPVTGVSLNKSTLELPVGKTETLIATVEPSDADNLNVSWTSGNESIVSVDAVGKLTALVVDNDPITITVTTEDGNFTAECAVTVIPDPSVCTTISQLSTAILNGDITDEHIPNYVGVKFVQADGTLTVSQTGAVGVIAYISTDRTDVDPAIADSRILVLSLSNNGWVIFGPTGTYVGKEGYAMGLEKGDDSSYQAINKAWHYGSSGYGLTGETGAKGHWFLPSRTQMEKMGARHQNLQDPWNTFAPMTNNYQYWSSTESDGTFGNIYWATNIWQSVNKSNASGWVRPVFAY